MAAILRKLRISKSARTAAANAKDDDDDVSICSSLSSRSDHDDHPPAMFENGMVVKPIDDTVLLQQAEESLQSTLNLIDEARDSTKTWVDARELLDQTASALDDAGLALRGRPGPEQSSHSVGSGSRSRGRGSLISRVSIISKSSDGSSRKGPKKGSEQDPVEEDAEARVRRLADTVIDRRRSLLGDVLVHDADGPWAKMQYGDGDGISFHADAPYRVPDEDKDNRALIAWASQTGTAKKFARKLCKRLGGEDCCVRRNMKTLTIHDLAKHKRVYFVCSTFGFGRPPSDGEVFFSILQLGVMQCEDNAEDLSEFEQEKPLQGTSFAVAALGSSAFPNFAKFGFGLQKEISALGGDMIKDVTTLDAKGGKVKQAASFQAWADSVVEIENKRLGGRTRRAPKRQSAVGMIQGAVLQKINGEEAVQGEGAHAA